METGYSERECVIFQYEIIPCKLDAQKEINIIITFSADLYTVTIYTGYFSHHLIFFIGPNLCCLDQDVSVGEYVQQ